MSPPACRPGSFGIPTGLAAAFRLFRGQQQAVGELMMVRTGSRYENLGHTACCERLDTDPRFATWFERLRADVDAVVEAVQAAEPGGNCRLVVLQHALIELIDFLDPDRHRLGTGRANLAMPARSAVCGSPTCASRGRR